MKLTKAEICSIIITVLFIAATAAVTLSGSSFSPRQSITIRSESAVPSVSDAPAPDEADKININTASSEELCSLPGIGEVLSKAIIEYRSTNGAFTSPEELMLVSGIGEGKYKSIQDLITAQ